MTGSEWLQVMTGMSLLIVLFAFPVISIWLDERRKRGARDDPADEPPAPNEQAQSRYPSFRNR
jgi:hypothetical protein